MADPKDPLFSELLNRAAAENKTPLPTALSVFDSRIPEDFAIHKALLALKGIGYQGTILPRVNSWADFPFKDDPRLSVQMRPVGWVTNQDQKQNTVHIADYSDGYKNALKGNAGAIKQLAATIAHEDTHNHQTEGFDEGPAYRKQLDVLKQLKAPRAIIEQIQHVASVLAQKK